MLAIVSKWNFFRALVVEKQTFETSNIWNKKTHEDVDGSVAFNVSEKL